MIAEYTASLPRRSWWAGALQGFIGAVFYSVFIAVIVLVVKLSGSDVITILRMIIS